MRFPRNVKIFRGGIDAAPFAGLFFVLVLLMMMFYSHIFFPGVPIELTERVEEPEVMERSVKVFRSGEIRFLGTTIEGKDLAKVLQERAQKGTLPKRVILEAERGAATRVVDQVERELSGAGIAIKLPGTRLELPDDAGFAGAANPMVVVALNLNGQIFFQHQLLREEALQQRLSMAVERANGPLTLLLQADKKVPYDRIVRLSEIARKAGVAKVYWATRPGLS